ncbi:hypothetical protein Ddc_10082 [Ditylenchus destructor]|nr:hypothetical protein Ddc_10082 [Ditylenchus destructor]
MSSNQHGILDVTFVHQLHIFACSDTKIAGRITVATGPTLLDTVRFPILLRRCNFDIAFRNIYAMVFLLIIAVLSAQKWEK